LTSNMCPMCVCLRPKVCICIVDVPLKFEYHIETRDMLFFCTSRVMTLE
jgi:hypothetical protein